MILPSERRAFFAALARLGAVVLLPLTLVRSAGAQDVGPDQPLDNPDPASAELAALRQDLEALKAEVKRMNDQRGTIKAPFTVVNDADEPIFRMGINSSGQTRAAIGKAGGAVVVIGINEFGGPGVNLVDSTGKTRAALRGSEEGGQLLIDATDVNVRLGSGGDSSGKPGLFISKDKSAYIEMAVADTGGSIRTFDPTGKPIVAIGASKETPLAINDSAGKPFLSADIAADGTGRLSVGDKDKDHAAIGIAQGAAFMSLYGQSGNARVELNASDDFGVRLWDADKNAYFVVTNPKQPTVSIGPADKSQVILGMRESGAGSYIRLTDSEGKTRTTLESDPKRGFEMFDSAGTEQFAVGELDASSSMRLRLGDPAKQHVYLGMTDGPDQATVQLCDPSGKIRTEMNSSDDNGIRLFDANQKAYFTIGDVQVPTAWIGYKDEANVRLGVLPSGEGATMIMFDKGGTSRGYIIATEKSTQLNLNDKDMRVDLGRDITTEGFAGLTIGKDNKNFAIIHGTPDKGGSVLTANAAGKFVARVGTHPVGVGGELSVAGPDGGEPLIDFWADIEGTKMVMRDKSARPRVSISALDDDTTLRVLCADGASIALDAAERTMIEMTNAGDEAVIQIFENTNGLGVVRAGPKDSGVASMLGNQGVAASALLGKK